MYYRSLSSTCYAIIISGQSRERKTNIDPFTATTNMNFPRVIASVWKKYKENRCLAFVWALYIDQQQSPGCFCSYFWVKSKPLITQDQWGFSQKSLHNGHDSFPVAKTQTIMWEFVEEAVCFGSHSSYSWAVIEFGLSASLDIDTAA